MFVVRNTFQLRFGMAKEAIPVAKEMMALNERLGFGGGRLMVDAVTDFYTLVLELPIDSLTELDSRMSKMTGNPEWQACYARFTPLVQSGRRELFRVI